MFVEHKEAGEVKELDAAAKLLLKAATLIEEYGWCQKELITLDGRMCLIGAIDTANCHKMTYDSELAMARADAATGIESTTILREAATWNDAIGRKQDEVVALLRRAALA